MESSKGGPTDSLRFAYGELSDHASEEILVVSAFDGYAILNFLVPSYFDGDGTDFAEAMRNNTVDRSGALFIPGFDHQITYEIHQLEITNPDAAFLQSYHANIFGLISRERDCLNGLSSFLVENVISEEAIENCITDAYRQCLFDLMYWCYVYEVESETLFVSRSLTWES